MRAEPYSEFVQPDLAGAESLASLTSLVLYWGHVGPPDLAGAELLAGLTSLVLYWGHVPLSVPDVTKQSSCIMERLSRFFVKENCMS